MEINTRAGDYITSIDTVIYKVIVFRVLSAN